MTRLYHLADIVQLIRGIYDEGISRRSQRNKIRGNNCTNLRYADDAVFVRDNEDKLQTIITRVNET